MAQIRRTALPAKHTDVYARPSARLTPAPGTYPRQPCFLSDHHPRIPDMIKLAFVFLIIALIAGLLGLTGIAGVAVDIAMFLFIAALVIFAVLLILGLTVFKKVT
jgi:uncharacterized membrane protein YtjA (UPF0391 family)|tara:strand:- start:626 stop:940 length:315 start_codon:yes stop_codon:yes gene_type:complete